MKTKILSVCVVCAILSGMCAQYIAADSESGTQSETVTDRADDPASYDTPQGRKVQLYIIVALFAFGLVMVVVMIIKNYVASK